MKMIHMLVRHERVEWSIDRAGPRVQIKDAVAVHGVHAIFHFRLWSASRIVEVNRLHRPNFFEIQRRKPVCSSRSQISARSLDPENLDIVAGQWIALG